MSNPETFPLCSDASWRHLVGPILLYSISMQVLQGTGQGVPLVPGWERISLSLAPDRCCCEYSCSIDSLATCMAESTGECKDYRRGATPDSLAGILAICDSLIILMPRPSQAADAGSRLARVAARSTSLCTSAPRYFRIGGQRYRPASTVKLRGKHDRRRAAAGPSMPGYRGQSTAVATYVFLRRSCAARRCRCVGDVTKCRSALLGSAHRLRILHGNGNCKGTIAQHGHSHVVLLAEWPAHAAHAIARTGLFVWT